MAIFLISWLSQSCQFCTYPYIYMQGRETEFILLRKHSISFVNFHHFSEFNKINLYSMNWFSLTGHQVFSDLTEKQPNESVVTCGKILFRGSMFSSSEQLGRFQCKGYDFKKIKFRFLWISWACIKVRAYMDQHLEAEKAWNLMRGSEGNVKG